MNQPMNQTTDIQRLHWGCGANIAPGWINSDLIDAPGIDIPADIRKGLPIADESFDYIAAHHALQDLNIYEQVAAMSELRRVLKPGGVVRLSLADMDKFIAAYQRGDREFFFIYDWDTVAGNFITHLLWYNITHTPFTYEFAEELLKKAGFTTVRRAQYQQTNTAWPQIAELDSREQESFFVEAWR